MFNIKNFFYLIFAILVLSFIVLPIKAKASLADRLTGKILLQVEEKGEAWYVSPVSKERFFLGYPDDAFSIMRGQGLGITNNNLSKIPVSLDYLSGTDTDGDKLPDNLEISLGTNPNNKDSDGFGDYTEISQGYNPLGLGRLNYDDSFSKNQAGKIFLQVEKNGEAWYVNGEDNKRYFLGRPADAFSIMRNLGLGISNSDLSQIVAAKGAENSELVKSTIISTDPVTGQEMPPVEIVTTLDVKNTISEMDFGIISMPSVKDSLRESGVSESDPRMKTIGPFYQISPQGESFGGNISFSFCYFDEDIENYNESLFYIAHNISGKWEKIGGSPNPDKNCVEISLDRAPEYSISVYSGD